MSHMTYCRETRDKKNAVRVRVIYPTFQVNRCSLWAPQVKGPNPCSSGYISTTHQSFLCCTLTPAIHFNGSNGTAYTRPSKVQHSSQSAGIQGDFANSCWVVLVVWVGVDTQKDVLSIRIHPLGARRPHSFSKALDKCLCWIVHHRIQVFGSKIPKTCRLFRSYRFFPLLRCSVRSMQSFNSFFIL